MKLDFLRSVALFSAQTRSRATYYQNHRRFPPAFVRRFMLRYPHAHLYLVFGLCCSAMVGPVLHSVYLYMTMSKEEFKQYRDEQTVLVRDRQKYGKNLWIPFFSSGKPEEGEHPVAS